MATTRVKILISIPNVDPPVVALTGCVGPSPSHGHCLKLTGVVFAKYRKISQNSLRKGHGILKLQHVHKSTPHPALFYTKGDT